MQLKRIMLNHIALQNFCLAVSVFIYIFCFIILLHLSNCLCKCVTKAYSIMQALVASNFVCHGIINTFVHIKMSRFTRK